MQSRQKPDPNKMAEDLVAKLDTNNQGYLQKSDLETALSIVSGSSDSTSSLSADELFAKLDSDGDGKVTKQEMAATFEQISSELDGPFPRMRLQGQDGMPPPPSGELADQGLAKDQLTEMVNTTSVTGSGMSDGLNRLLDNFDQADNDGDGKITHDEAKSFYESQDAGASTTVTASSEQSSGTSDVQFMKTLLDLLHAYGGHDAGAQNGNSLSVSA
jgi:Ca2+-binding EF-hand superfamily protein